MTAYSHPEDLMAHLNYNELVPSALLKPRPVNALPGAISHFGLIYADVLGWRPLRLDLHLPEVGSGRHPVVVYVHGGSFLTGLPALGPWTTLPSQGIAVASISYRLSGEAAFPEPVEDVRAAIRWVKDSAAEYGLDSERVALWGSSAGAFLASTAAVLGERSIGRPVGTSTSSTQVTGVVDHYGITDTRRLSEDADSHSAPSVEGLTRIIGYFLRAGGPAPAVLDHLIEPASTPPFFIMHGDRDTRVGLGQSRRLHTGLVGLGVSSELVVVPGADHGDRAFGQLEYIRPAIEFLRRTWADRD